MSAAQYHTGWAFDRAAYRYILRGYLPWLTGLNLAWEIAHLPLYTLWQEASAAYKSFAALHCTVGDLLIGAVSLVLSLIIGREGPLISWRWRQIAFATVVLGIGYTVFSEWLNVQVLGSWSYSTSMPLIELRGVHIGLSPLLQWIVVPPLALYFGRRRLFAIEGRRPGRPG